MKNWDADWRIYVIIAKWCNLFNHLYWNTLSLLNTLKLTRLAHDFRRVVAFVSCFIYRNFNISLIGHLELLCLNEQPIKKLNVIALHLCVCEIINIKIILGWVQNVCPHIYCVSVWLTRNNNSFRLSRSGVHLIRLLKWKQWKISKYSGDQKYFHVF